MIFVQVLGAGDCKVLTLCHRAQVKRLITDLLKVLKAQPGKEVTLDELPKAYGELVLSSPEIWLYVIVITVILIVMSLILLFFHFEM